MAESDDNQSAMDDDDDDNDDDDDDASVASEVTSHIPLKTRSSSRVAAWLS